MDYFRDTDYVDLCPVCGHKNRHMSMMECEGCGWPIGPDWETVEIDLDTRVILRTVIPASAQPKQEDDDDD